MHNDRTHMFLPCLNKKLCRLMMGSSVPNVGDQAYANDLFDKYISLGGNCFDSAHIYAGGKAEQAIGNWMAARNNRADVVVLTKGAHHNRERKRVTPADIRADIADSLARLQTGYIDLYVLHRDDPDWPVGEIVECLAELQAAGTIRAFGGSNWSIARIEAANTYAVSHGLPGFAVSSPNVGLAYPNEPMWGNCVDACDLASRHWYQRSRLPVFAWSSLSNGFFSGKFLPLEQMTPEQREETLKKPPDVVRVYYSARNWQRYARANELAAKKGVNATQIALAWVLNQPLHLYALVAPRNHDEMQQLFDTLALDLTTSEMAWLNLEA